MTKKIPIEKLVAEGWVKVIDVGINNQVWKLGNKRRLYDSHDQVIVREYTMEMRRTNPDSYQEEARGV